MAEILYDLRWQDVLDIVLNSYVFFRFYILFRGTNVLRVLFGLACIWFAQRIAISLGLIVSSWISQGITAAAALLVVVIFRNEIRSVLQTKNIKAILWGLPKKETTTPIEIIAASAFELARRRIGALIVVPGKDNLEEIIQHGIDWQGTISKEMLMSIFWPDNPVHDGAALTRADRVEEVSCILPLSVRDDLPSNYGTRHRAALGLAENSDALVVIVSEERGEVAVAKNGRISKVQIPATLEKQLRDHAGLLFTTRQGVLNEKLEIGLASILSLAFTMGIWFSITRGLDTLATYEIPLEYMNRNPSQEIVSVSENTVKLQISGSRSLLRTVSADQLRVRLDLSKATVGENTFTISRENITLPPGVLLKDVQPPLIDVNLDVLAEKEIPIQVDWVGKLENGLLLTAVRTVPQTVVVIGASRYLNTLDTIYTEKVPVEPLRQSGTLVATLALNPARLKLAPGYEDAVTVDYTIKKGPTVQVD
jgi:uncharacterized protein (TIGR00159 family)